MTKTWIQIDDLKVNFDLIPGLLDRYNLLPTFLRKLLQTKYSSTIKITSEEQVDYFRKFLLENRIDDKEALTNWLLKNGLDDKRLDILLIEQLQLGKFKKKTFGQEIEAIYLKQKSLLDKVLYSVLRVESRSQAEELFIKLEEQESTFAELASKYGQGIEKDQNGLTGPIEFGRIKVEIRERLRTSKPGQLWPPFEFDKW